MQLGIFQSDAISDSSLWLILSILSISVNGPQKTGGKIPH